ncbi:hypothetical protein GGF31_004648 [Allomyces arbusculus]|nr:hypothetical protein GGF31_004648 [Allomyces arbusculus]
MPPKRAKGLKKSAEPSAKRARTEADTPSPAPGANDPQPVYVGEVDEEDDVAELVALATAAKAKLAAGDEHGKPLARGTVHEAQRLLNVDTLLHAERRAVLLALATALVLLASYDADALDNSPTEVADVATGHVDEAAAITESDKVVPGAPSVENVRAYVALSGAVLGDDAEALATAVKDLAAQLTGDDHETLAWFAQRRLETAENVDAWADACTALWTSLAKDATEGAEAARELGQGLCLLAKATAIVEEQGELAGEDDGKVDKKVVKRARKMLEKAETHIKAAINADSHPSAQHFVPLAETHVNLGTIGELLDEGASSVCSRYEQAVAAFKKAREHDPEAVDEDMVEGLQTTIAEIRAEEDDE